MSRPTHMTIDIAALRHNLNRVHEYAPKQYIIAMVKANAYGHGLARVAKALPMADAFGVASLEEGVILREAGIKQPIILMEGLFNADEIYEAAKHQFTLVVHHQPHVDMLKDISVEKPFPVWLKINTGMYRLGFDPADLPHVYEQLTRLPSVQKPIGLMTHFAEADSPNPASMYKQIEVFCEATVNFKGPRSLANSAAIITTTTAHGDWVRPGLMLYGASPFRDKIGADYGLKPVMTLHSKIIAINKVKKGGKVGYGGTWCADEDMLVGVVGVGYGDGYPQFAGNGTPVLVNNQQCKLVGRVSMDMLTVDLRNSVHAKIGDPVVLWGEGLPVEYVARYCNTTPYEILTRMTPRPKVDVRDDTSIINKKEISV